MADRLRDEWRPLGLGHPIRARPDKSPAETGYTQRPADLDAAWRRVERWHTAGNPWGMVPAPGLAVLDVDAYKYGSETAEYAALARLVAQLPHTLRVTRRKCALSGHYWFRCATPHLLPRNPTFEGVKVGQWILPGQHQVLMPGSVVEGRTYKVITRPTTKKLPQAPTGLFVGAAPVRQLDEECREWGAWVERTYGVRLQERSGQLEGPCPFCKAGTDRFYIHKLDGRLLVQCRQCPPDRPVFTRLQRRRQKQERRVVKRVGAYVGSIDWRRGVERLILLPDTPLPEPTVVAADADGQPLLRGGQVVWLYGAPKSGKSWATMAAAAATAGRTLVLAYERTEETRHRLWNMAEADPALRKRVGVLPGAILSPKLVVDLTAWLDDAPASLVVVDAASSSGCPIDGANIAPWYAKVVAPWVAPARTVVVVDHTPRRDAQAGRNAGAIGSQTKTAAADVQYRVDADTTDAVGRLQTATLTDTGSNARWHPRTVCLVLRKGIPALTSQDKHVRLSRDDALAAKRDGTFPSWKAAAEAAGVSSATLRRHAKAHPPKEDTE